MILTIERILKWMGHLKLLFYKCAAQTNNIKMKTFLFSGGLARSSSQNGQARR